MDDLRNPLLGKWDRPRVHKWPVDKSDYGPEHDYYTIEKGDYTIIYCVSNAALQWIYRYLPPWVDRWRDRGFVIEKKWIRFVTAHMAKDRLVSLLEYQSALEENDRARQWENKEN